MQGCFPRFGIGSFLLFSLLASFNLSAAEIPPTWIDDAQLHDVKLVGSKFAIAVGEHGAILKSTDGGRNWNVTNCGMDVSLKSICFLDDQTGWIAGCETAGYSGLDAGILLATTDGCKTWQRLGKGLLPSLGYVKFFGMEDGLVVGQPLPLSPAGIFKTSDGGKTWHGVQGEAPHPWKSACFLEPEMGVVAGVSGRVSLMGGDQLYPSKLQPQGFRSIRAIGLSADDSGWLAGDGGLILKTATGGVVWETPEQSLPEETRDVMDFRTIDVRGENVWLGGSPGSVIWHSPDAGLHWEKQSTGQTSPLSAVRFSNSQQGIAVGAFGVILRTEDGGKNWNSVRAAGRRAAILTLHARSGQTHPALITKLSGEMGYRSAVWVAQRDDLGPLSLSTESESVLQVAVQKSGGHAADIHWQLPQIKPGIEYSSDNLLEEWQKQTEGRLPQKLLGQIVRQIRIWRPSVIIIDQPSPDDAAGQLLFDATLRAVAQASDAARYPEHAQFAELAPWNVDRIYTRLAAGANGDTHVELDEFLMSLKTSTRNAAAPAIALLQSGRVPLSETAEASRIAYRWIGLDGQPAQDASQENRGKGTVKRVSRDFFGGSSISPGSAARRDMLPIDETNLERTQKLVEKQRNFTGLFQKSLDDPRLAGQIIGQINGIVDGMEPQQAVGLLRDLADEYRKRSQFEFVESTYVELIRRYPTEPGALDAMRWLIQFWSSNETAWQRTRAMKTNTTVSQKSNPKQVQQALGQFSEEGGIQQASGLSGVPNSTAHSSTASPTRIDMKLDFDAKDPPNRKSKNQGRMKVSREVDWRTGAVSEWRGRANELAKLLQKAEPTFFLSPEIQFPLAVLKRSDGSSRNADSIIRYFVTNPTNSDIKQLAERELWASFSTLESPKAMTICYQSENRPRLDGVLSDPCWGDAKELHLTATAAESDLAENSGDPSRTLVMFAFDPEFFYVALKVPRVNGPPQDPPQTTGRQHDEDLSRHDRVSIRLDIDRDYTTWYEFQVDQRGRTSESCWEDRRWNPTWYVAAETDETDWRIEAAIPWNDLTPTPPGRGTIYAVSILRTTPTVGLQTWNHPATAKPAPASFGLLKFE